jgi:hypothetical protein
MSNTHDEVNRKMSTTHTRNRLSPVRRKRRKTPPVKKTRLKGPAHVVNDQWKLDVRKWLTDQGWPDQKLGPLVGLSQSGVSRLLETEQEAKEKGRSAQSTSRAALKVSEVTGVPLPMSTPGTDAIARWNALGAKLQRERPEEYERFLALLESIAGPQTKS